MTGIGEAGVVAVRSGPSFDRLYQAEYRPLLARGWTLTGSREAAEELVQDAFLDAYRRWDHVGSLDRPGAWVRRAVANRAVSHRRHLRVVELGAARLAAIEDTARDTLAWQRATPDASTTGMDRAKEAELLAAWHNLPG